MTDRVAVIIVNYRTPGMVVDCLGSLAGEREAAFTPHVVVVDNASGDGSPERIERAVEERGWGGWVEVIRSPVNRGFAGGNNIGIRAGDAEYYLLLNSDTLVRAGAIRELRTAMRERPGVGIAAPRLEWPDATPQESCFRFRTPLTELLIGAQTGPLNKLMGGWQTTLPVSDEPIEPDWVSFACAMVRRETFERVGLLDEGYFMYYDDIDLGRRVRRGGWSILYWPRARVVHLRGGSGPVKTLSETKQRRPAYLYASRARYFARFYGRPGLWAANVCWEIGRGISLVREWCGRENGHVCEREPRDIWINALRPLKPPDPAWSDPA